MTTLIPAWIDGQLTPVEKLEVHEKGLRHKAVSVFVMAGDKTLIQQRALGKYHTPGLWANTCCTHPLWDEAASVCATRRLDQELGIKGLKPVYRDRIEYRAEVGGGLTEHEVVDLFTAEAPVNLAFALNPDEVESVAWVTLDELRADIARSPETFTPWLRIYMAEHGERIFGQLVTT